MEEETVENRFGFAGEMLDAVTGQYYLRARFYNPVRYVDPSGHEGLICSKKYGELKKKETEGGTLSEKEKRQIYEYEQNQKKSNGPGSDSKSGSKSGSGSKFQEVFDLADNYTLSDDTFDNHILDRHGPNSTYGNKSHFNADFDIRNSIDSTLTGDNFIVGPNTAGREGYIFEQTFSNPIGTNSKGKPLYTLKVVIDEAGNVITAFPKK